MAGVRDTDYWPEVDRKAQEIVDGLEVVRSIVPGTTVKTYLDTLQGDYQKMIAHMNGVPEGWWREQDRIRILSAREAIRRLEAML